MIKFTLWQVWPDEVNKPWTYIAILYAESMDAAAQHFKNQGNMYPEYEYIITVS